MEYVRATHLLRKITERTVTYQQCRSYQPIKLNKIIADRLDRVRKPFIPTDHPDLVTEWQKRPDNIKKYKQQAWAKFGSASGVDLSSTLPTKKELQAEWEAEKEWWPTLQKMKDNIKKKNEQIKADNEAREKKIAENLAKMPQWIEKWEQEKKRAGELEKRAEEKKEKLVARVMEQTNYTLEQTSRAFKEVLAGEMKEEKKRKKKEKRLIKQT